MSFERRQYFHAQVALCRLLLLSQSAVLILISELPVKVMPRPRGNV